MSPRRKHTPPPDDFDEWQRRLQEMFVKLYAPTADERALDKVRKLYAHGKSAEELGNVHEALAFYRKAVELGLGLSQR